MSAIAIAAATNTEIENDANCWIADLEPLFDVDEFPLTVVVTSSMPL